MITYRFLLFVWLLLSAAVSNAQISGIINHYAPVTQISCNTVTVASAAGFSAGDRVLIIQMKGAVINTTNTAAYGTIMNYGDCGHYEFANITSVSGNSITLQFSLVNTYTVSGIVQLVRVPQYTNVTVSGVLTAQTWNGATGGVLALEVSGTLTLNADINVSGKGFRGGAACSNPDGGCGSGYTNYAYAVTSGFGAEKGEGITVVAANQDGGMGAAGNGGGGGNKHNSGGGGGGNSSAGGTGGFQASFCAMSDVGGRGGRALDYTPANLLFAGGGGGAPDHNDGVGTPGTNGGGIVIIRAANLQSANSTIEANGLDVALNPNSIGDGAGGGGAGGTILMDVQTYTGNLALITKGGKGGDQQTSFSSCFGPGGGGGAGIVLTAQNSLPFNVSITMMAGNGGISLSGPSVCNMLAYGATDGDPAAPARFNRLIPEGTIPVAPIVLDLGPDIVTCAPSAVLDATNPGATYVWSTGESSPAITISDAGEYWVTVTDACGGIARDTVTFSEIVVSQLDLGSDTAVCLPGILLDAGPGFLSYAWSDGSTGQTFAATTFGSFWVMVTDSCGTQNDSLTIIEKMPPALELGDERRICVGDSISIAASSAFSVFQWTPASGLSCGDCSVPFAGPATTTSYVLVAATAEGCVGTDSVTVLVEEHVPETLPFIATEGTCREAATLQFLPDGNSDLYYYSFNNGEITDVNLYTGLSPGNYPVQVYYDPESLCYFDTIVAVTGEYNTLFIPNAFTPDSDGSPNSVWKIEGNCIAGIECVIFDRWGEEIAKIIDPAGSWDGRYANKPVPDGIYVYKVTVTYGSGEIGYAYGSIAVLW